MDDTLCQVFFSQPTCPAQRQYEALRAVFIDRLPQNVAAQRFGYSPQAFRQLVHRFRQDLATGTTPPFSSPNGADGPPDRLGREQGNPTHPRSPTSVPWN